MWNYAALKSPVSGDVVSFGLDITPANAEAASLASWTGAIPATDNLTATVAADSVSGPTAVTASACDFTTDPFTVWIFWGAVGFNFNDDLADDDALTFTGWSGINLPNPKKAGSAIGVFTTSSPGVSVKLAASKVEIIGTLEPAGIGDLVGNIFNFNPQKVEYYVWAQGGTRDGDPLTSVSSSTAGAAHGPENDTTLPQQTTLTSDKIYALDAPGTGAFMAQTGYGALAVNFKTYIYIGSGSSAVKASDAGLWNVRCRATFSSSSVTATPCSPGLGEITLPTTWGSTDW